MNHFQVETGMVETLIKVTAPMQVHVITDTKAADEQRDPGLLARMAAWVQAQVHADSVETAEPACDPAHI